MTFNLSELSKAVGAAPRSVQFWTDRGVLLAEAVGGKGNHRSYLKKEKVIAEVAAALASLGMGVAMIKRICAKLRPKTGRCPPNEYLVITFHGNDPWPMWLPERHLKEADLSARSIILRIET